MAQAVAFDVVGFSGRERMKERWKILRRHLIVAGEDDRRIELEKQLAEVYHHDHEVPVEQIDVQLGRKEDSDNQAQLRLAPYHASAGYESPITPTRWC